MHLLKKLVRSFLPQQLINIFYHLPKAILANMVYGFPTRSLKVIGVTGTDGKTTTVNMIYRILKSAGVKASMVSTVNAEIAGQVVDTGFHVTSPDPFSVQRFAREALDKGDKYLVLEVTSHALDQYRFWGVKFDMGLVTNITHEHLDYHKTFENYKKTKLSLLKKVKIAVINENLYQNDVRSHTIMISGKTVTFGINMGDFNQKALKLKLKVPGDYNVENALAAMAVCYYLGVDTRSARETLINFKLPTGRMDGVRNSLGIRIFIDFAHTPNGMEQALKTLHSHLSSGKLVSLIGCEGYRDVGKRAMMGEIAQKLSNYVIVTEVDSRGLLDTINEQIKSGALKSGAKEGKNFFIIKNRTAAIDFAVNSLAKKGDIVGIFGKGHEQSMNLDGKKEVPWSDFTAVQKALQHGR